MKYFLSELPSVSYKNLIINLFVIFLLGQFLIGIIGWFIYDFKSYNYPSLIVVLPFLKSLIVLTYCIFSSYHFYCIAKKQSEVFFLSVKYFLVFYYIASVFSYTFYLSYTPLTYASSFVYNGLKNNTWNQSLIDYQNNSFCQENGVKC